jgi:hypothetical protein
VPSVSLMKSQASNVSSVNGTTPMAEKIVSNAIPLFHLPALFRCRLQRVSCIWMPSYISERRSSARHTNGMGWASRLRSWRLVLQRRRSKGRKRLTVGSAAVYRKSDNVPRVRVMSCGATARNNSTSHPTNPRARSTYQARPRSNYSPPLPQPKPE